MPTVHWPADKFLLARRLVEAGVSVVTMRVSPWDYHGKGSGTGNIFTGLRSLLPLLDRSLYALVTDLHERGLDKEVLVLVWGEFGRTPKVNKDEGRDHWPDVGFAMFAGGGLKTGQVVGRTDSKAERPKDRASAPRTSLARSTTRLASTRGRRCRTSAAGRCVCWTTAIPSRSWCRFHKAVSSRQRAGSMGGPYRSPTLFHPPPNSSAVTIGRAASPDSVDDNPRPGKTSRPA